LYSFLLLLQSLVLNFQFVLPFGVRFLPQSDLRYCFIVFS
jgi:hypothetical protein